MSQVRDAFGVELPLKTVFDARTLETLAGQIDLALLERRYAPRMPTIEATLQQGPAPLSFSQERMWLIQSLDPAATAYNIAVVLRDQRAIGYSRAFRRSRGPARASRRFCAPRSGSWTIGRSRRSGQRPTSR